MGEIIPLLDLKRQHSPIIKDIQSAIAKVIDSGRYVLGSQVREFEDEFADYCGARYCASVGNGTDALEIALRSLGVGSGDIVATVANAGMYSTSAINLVGATPLYIDVDSASMLMDTTDLQNKISAGIKAVIVTHLYGRMADMKVVKALAQRSGVPVIEDCAQAHGASLEGKKAGTWGDIGCFSFYPTKNLGALGDGGAIITNDEDLHEAVCQLRQYGWSSKYHSVRINGRNSRMDEIQAAVLRVKLPFLDQWNYERLSIAKYYSDELSACKIIVPDLNDTTYVAHLYVIRTSWRNNLRDFLRGKGIQTDIHYPVPDYRQVCMHKKVGRLNLSVTEECCDEVLTLPCFSGFSCREASIVIENTRQFISCCRE